jgi:hypothetical protein
MWRPPSLDVQAQAVRVVDGFKEEAMLLDPLDAEGVAHTAHLHRLVANGFLGDVRGSARANVSHFRERVVLLPCGSLLACDFVKLAGFLAIQIPDPSVEPAFPYSAPSIHCALQSLHTGSCSKTEAPSSHAALQAHMCEARLGT